MQCHEKASWASKWLLKPPLGLKKHPRRHWDTVAYDLLRFHQGQALLLLPSECFYCSLVAGVQFALCFLNAPCIISCLSKSKEMLSASQDRYGKVSWTNKRDSYVLKRLYIKSFSVKRWNHQRFTFCFFLFLRYFLPIVKVFSQGYHLVNNSKDVFAICERNSYSLCKKYQWFPWNMCSHKCLLQQANS